MKKRILALLLALALLALPACGAKEAGAFRPLEVIGTKHYGVICRKGDQIAPVIDAAMRVLAANGTLAAISFQNLGRSAIDLEGDEKALDDLDREIPRRTLIVGVHAAFRPIAFEANGEMQGMSVDIARHLCSLLGLDCRMVYGQRSWEDYCWNIVSVDENYYHIDPAVCAQGDLDGGFLLRDEIMWENCRWDVAAYPACDGELSWYFLQVQDGLIEPEETPELPETGEETVENPEEASQDAVIELTEEPQPAEDREN